MQEKLDEIQKAMYIDKTQLSVSTRKRTSASDPRPSSAAIGVIGGLILGLVMLSIVLSDMPRIIRSLKKHCKKSRF